MILFILYLFLFTTLTSIPGNILISLNEAGLIPGFFIAGYYLAAFVLFIWLTIRLYRGSQKKNQKRLADYNEQLEKWQRLWHCMRCGMIFAP